MGDADRRTAQPRVWRFPLITSSILPRTMPGTDSGRTRTHRTGLDCRTITRWHGRSVASSLSGTPGVIGYDIMNEPWPGTPWVATLLGGTFFANQQLAPMYNQVAAAIRAVDPNTTLYIEPANPGAVEVGNIFGLPVNLGTMNTRISVLAFHDYCGGLGGLCPLIANALADGAQKYALEHNIPAFMNEFGATGDTTELTTEMLAGDKYQMSWTVWAYTAKGDITTSDSTGEEALVFDPALPPVGDNVNTTTLKTIAVPYPQVISGTPNSWSFATAPSSSATPPTRLTARAASPPARRPPSQCQPSSFPNGYQVTRHRWARCLGPQRPPTGHRVRCRRHHHQRRGEHCR